VDADIDALLASLRERTDVLEYEREPGHHEATLQDVAR